MLIIKLVYHGKIQHIKTNRFASPFHNEKGFTLLNLLYSFVIYALIISSLTMILTFLVTNSQYSKDLKPYEWELFIIQLHQEMKNSVNWTVNNNELLFENKQGQLISISKYNQLIRRQVYGMGHEILLMKIGTLNFEQQQEGIKMTVSSQAGKEYTHTFRSYKDLSR
ncbi:competence type IV pilus minor pilin ComGF [Metabacillus litoralis]|uniref:competence type IV pilus minor pilin ComGF n=1 Tax=Metabacillus litoralis TaxID=152268 RepID=UPI00308468C2